MNKPTFKILEENILPYLNGTVTISGIISTGTSHVFSTTDTKWISWGNRILIGSDEFKVTAVSPGVSFTATHATADPTGTTEVECITPDFRAGTPIAVDREFTSDKDAIYDKLPLIWLREIISEQFDDDPFSAIDRETDCEIHFITEANFKEWNISDHYPSIQAMRNLRDEFIRILKMKLPVDSLPSYRSMDIQNWGRYDAGKGTVAQLFKVDASGVMINVTIPFTKSCCNNC